MHRCFFHPAAIFVALVGMCPNALDTAVRADNLLFARPATGCLGPGKPRDFERIFAHDGLDDLEGHRYEVESRRGDMRHVSE